MELAPGEIDFNARALFEDNGNKELIKDLTYSVADNMSWIFSLYFYRGSVGSDPTLSCRYPTVHLDANQSVDGWLENLAAPLAHAIFFITNSFFRHD